MGLTKYDLFSILDHVNEQDVKTTMPPKLCRPSTRLLIWGPGFEPRWRHTSALLEIDSEQHYVDERIIEHDKIRTANLECEGWTCIERIRWSDYQKLNENEKKEFLQKLLTKLK